MNDHRTECFESAKRIVVKVGSSVLTETEAQGLDIHAIRSISKQVSKLIDEGREVILVSSGAMASGVMKIGLAKRPDDIPKQQAAAAVGQAGLMMEYEKAFEKYDKKVAQILLTNDDFRSRKRYLNARNTLYTLLSWHVIPVINENDTVVVEEIRFGDNDNLAAMLTLLIGADLLVNLTDIDGLYTQDPRIHKEAKLIPIVSAITRSTEKLASDIPGALGTGGMFSKIQAAKKVTSAGIPMVIAGGRRKDVLTGLFSGHPIGTFFTPKKERLSSRKCWIAFTLKPEGIIQIDDGAASAILNKGKSILPVGIVSVKGDFNIGAPVEFTTSNNKKLGIGLVNYSSSDIHEIKGLRTDQIQDRLGYKPYDEVMHRDNLTIIDE